MIESKTILYGEDYSAKTQLFILWFFRLLLFFALLCLVLLFTVHINDTVLFKQGEIVSQNPQLDIKAPFEAQLQKVYVSEGQKVNTGDTLIVIYNEANTSAYTTQKAEKEFLEKKLVSVQALLNSLGKKKSETGVENSLNSSSRNLNVKSVKNSIEALELNYKLLQQKLNSALERNQADSILYAKDMLSKVEYYDSKDLVNDIRESLNSTRDELQRQRSQVDATDNDFASKQHQLTLRKIELEENDQNLLQQQIALESDINKAKENLSLLEYELAKQYVIAGTSGTVNYIFTSKLATNLISKNDLLVSISPDKNDFYAKIVLPENQIQYVKATMPAHLQLDAYYHLEYGVIQGTVTYISARKESDNFYALIKLNNTKNFQLKAGYNVSGEIITDNLVMFRYFIKKLFKQFDIKPENKPGNKPL